MAEYASFLGTGWNFPPDFTHNGQDVLLVSAADDVHQSIEILLSTRIGERVMLENYGCELSEYLFEEVDQSLFNNLSSLIKNAITHHERRVTLDSIDIDQSQSVNGLLLIHLNYTIRSTNSRYNMVYPFYINEASNPVVESND